jgi:hypothetical protein
MTEDEMLDRQIGALLRGRERAPDEAFPRRVERRLAAERRLEAARQASWKRFAAEVVASAGMLAAFILLYRLAPEVPLEALSPVSPAVAAALLLALWFGVELRSSAARN